MSLVFLMSRFKPTRTVVLIHALLMLQMLVFGLHLVPHPAAIRTLSGQLFITGVLFFVWQNLLSNRKDSSTDSSPLKYSCRTAAALLALQLLVRAQSPIAGALVETLGLLGIAAVFVAGTMTIADICSLVIKTLTSRALMGRFAHER